MSKNCIINVSIGGWYPKGQARLKESLNKHAPDVDTLFWCNSYPPGCPDHAQVPYAFKMYSFLAARSQGYTNVLWLDSAAYAVRPVEPLFEHLNARGHYLQHNPGHRTGEWCTDAALVSLGKTREELMEMPHLMACIMGLNFKNLKSNQFLDRMLEFSKDGVTFQGPWHNKNGEASVDKRVKGHRHDQTAGSVLSIEMGMDWVLIGGSRLSYGPPATKIPERVLFLSRGM